MITCPHCKQDFDPSWTDYCPECGGYPEDKREEIHYESSE